MPLGNSDTGFVPEGHPTIARRFNAGSSREYRQVPEGRLRWLPIVPEFQPSLRDSYKPDSNPGVETPGYCRVSLRDRGRSIRRRRGVIVNNTPAFG